MKKQHLTSARKSALQTERQCYLDRELSWLQFNLRVLMEAADASIPILERLKFLSIYFSNLDEFFMVRVGRLIHQNLLFPNSTDLKTGWTPLLQLKRIAREVHRQQAIAEELFRTLCLDLAQHGVDVLSFEKTSKVEETMAKKLFVDMRHLLSPRILSLRQTMPFLGNKEDYVVCALSKGDSQSFGIISLYRLPKFCVFELEGRQKLVIVSELVRRFAGMLFKNYEVKSTCAVRVTRNADVLMEEVPYTSEEHRDDMERMLRKRKRQQPVRIQVSGKPSSNLLSFVLRSVRVPERSVFVSSSLPFNVSFAPFLHATPDMKYPDRRPVRTVKLSKGEYFKYLEQKDILLSFPYQSMTPFIEMLYEAADDPEVVSIRISLYRLAASSKLAAALAYAAERGKDVLCLLELRARFDERNNIDYSEVLSDAGCTVIYGLPGKKVHCKLCVIARRHGEKFSYITQVGTGNYNEVTSEQYCDLSLITSDYQVGLDAMAIFDMLAVGQTPNETQKLWVAPSCYETQFMDCLEQERQKGSLGYIAIKVNSLNDINVMRKLIECSQAGNEVHLFVRGICCIRPGIPAYTENIRVKSVVGRYLEHSRIFVFGRDPDRRIFIGSGDLLTRNTQHRVETFIEVERDAVRAQVLETMEAFRADNEKGWLMQSDGSYLNRPHRVGTSSQERLFHYFVSQSVELAEEKQSGFFSRIFGSFFK